MTDVFLERQWDTPLTAADLEAMVAGTNSCLDLYRVVWQQSFLSADCRTMLCHFSGPDAESARAAMRQADVDPANLWPGTIHDAPGVTGDDLHSANVLVKRSFDEPVAIGDIQALEDASAGCLETHRVSFVRTFFSTDRRRMACLYRAPDAESVRIAQHQAQMPMDRVWAFHRMAP